MRTFFNNDYISGIEMRTSNSNGFSNTNMHDTFLAKLTFIMDSAVRDLTTISTSCETITQIQTGDSQANSKLIAQAMNKALQKVKDLQDKLNGLSPDQEQGTSPGPK